MEKAKPEHSRSIAQVNRMLRSLVESETLESYFWVGGKIERYYRSDRGHIYFDLVDDKTRIRCMLRDERRGQVELELRNFLDVEVYGDVQFYEDRAEAQLNVLDARRTGSEVASVTVKERLRRDKLYPPQKQAPPRTIRRIGVITSRGSRAVGDFEDTYQRAGERGVLAPVTWRYVSLEGKQAARSIVEAIASLDSEPSLSAIAIIRGGGRYQNLALFEQYEVVRAVAACRTFILTGIGHYKDQSFADEVADYAAATPTAAALYLAELCLRPAPMPPAWEAQEPPPEAAWDSHAPPPPEEPGKTSSPSKLARPPAPQNPPSPRWMQALILTLLVLAIASVALLAYVALSVAN